MPSEVAPGGEGTEVSVVRLRQVLGGDTSVDAISRVLRGLQERGLTQAELQAHIERFRAENDATLNSAIVEDNAQLALDLVLGSPIEESLSWDSTRMAAVQVARSLDRETIRRSAEYAQRPSDLLPPRPIARVPEDTLNELSDAVAGVVQSFQAEPTQADFFRVPKGAFTTRPAALLAWQDRIVLEGLATLFERRLEDALPVPVQWPRGRARPEFSPVDATVRSWESPYVVRADIEAFYDSVDHDLLAALLQHHIPTEGPADSAVSAFLDSVMASAVGLPQGVQASDVFAGAYLLPLDLALEAAGWRWTRVGDDYWFAANSIVNARERLAMLEGWLQALRLRLNGEKTLVMRRSTFERQLRPRMTRVQRHLSRLSRDTEESLFKGDVDEVAERLVAHGVSEETLWDVFYHRSVSLSSVVASVRERMLPKLTDLYATDVRHIVQRIKRRDLPDSRGTFERDLSDALSFLTGSGVELPPKDLEIIGQWFPRLAPRLAQYLRGAEDTYLRDTLQEIADPARLGDWITAWLLSAAEERKGIVDAELEGALGRILSEAEGGPLSRVSASRTLARAGALSRHQFWAVWEGASPAIRSEIAFSVLAERDLYRNLAPREIEEEYGGARWRRP
jgi:hypothetical protein